jgi:hypothetical protein
MTDAQMGALGELGKAKKTLQGSNRAISPLMVNEVSTSIFALFPTARFRIVAAQIPRRAASPFNLPLIGLP